MFLQTKSFHSLQPSFHHKQTSSNLGFESDKENRPISQIQIRRQPYSEQPEVHAHHQRNKTMMTNGEYNQSAMPAVKPTYDYSSMFSGIMAKETNNNIQNKNSDICRHSCKEKFKRSYCKECGIFIPKVQ